MSNSDYQAMHQINKFKVMITNFVLWVATILQITSFMDLHLKPMSQVMRAIFLCSVVKWVLWPRLCYAICYAKQLSRRKLDSLLNIMPSAKATQNLYVGEDDKESTLIANSLVSCKSLLKQCLH
jgi:hypothetical protein